MITIRHRVNSLGELATVPTTQGVEVDIRSDTTGLLLAHDPFVRGIRLAEYLESFRHKLLILNVKEDGLEDECARQLSRHGISNYFFLDQQIPTLIKTPLSREVQSACRFSKYESLDTVIKLAPHASWVWVDTLHGFSPSTSDFEQLKDLGLKICIASPELHGSDQAGSAAALANHLSTFDIAADAVCTKLPKLWNP